MKILRSKRGEGYIDVAVLVLCAMLVIALAVSVFPVYIAKQQIDTSPQNSSEKQRSPDAWEPRHPCRNSSCGSGPGSRLT